MNSCGYVHSLVISDILECLKFMTKQPMWRLFCKILSLKLSFYIFYWNMSNNKDSQPRHEYLVGLSPPFLHSDGQKLNSEIKSYRQLKRLPVISHVCAIHLHALTHTHTHTFYNLFHYLLIAFFYKPCFLYLCFFNMGAFLHTLCKKNVTCCRRWKLLYNVITYISFALWNIS